MKSVYNKITRFLDDNDQTVGVDIGADHTCEHECGIRKLLRIFKCDESLEGLDSRKITFDATHLLSLVKDGETYQCITSVPDFPVSMLKSWPTLRVDGNEGVKVIAGWDEGSFLVGFTDGTITEALQKGFTDMDMVISVGSSGPFKNGGLHLLRYSAIPAEALEASRNMEREYKSAQDRLETSKEYLLLKARDLEWRSKYPFCGDSPWTYFALSPRAGVDKVWLNPRNQHHLNCGHLSLADIGDWANGIPGKVIPSKEKWEDLLWELSMPVTSVYATRGDGVDRFRRVDPSLYKGRREVHKVPRKDKHSAYLKLSEDNRDLFEAAAKREMLDSMFRQIKVYGYKDYPVEMRKAALLKYRDSGAKETIRPDKSTEERIGGMMYSLYLLGFGDYGACNVQGPRGFANLSFWKSTLQDEVSYDFMDLCDMIPESRRIAPWKPLPEGK